MTRRQLLTRAGKWAVGLGLSFPLYSFIMKKRYRPPIQVRIKESLQPGQFLMEKEFALFQTADGPIAVSRRCTHLGCIINYHEAEKMFLCPCHQSKFHWDGRYISGPAKKDLYRLKVRSIEGGKGFLVEIPRGKV